MARRTMIGQLVRYLTRMDVRAARTVAVSLTLLAIVAAIFVMGRTTAVFDEDDAPLIAWMQANAQSPWALPATVAVFTIAAFVGAPQFVLIAAAVVAFGPVRGFAYAWAATMVSASVDFQLARMFGARALRAYGGDAVNRISKLVGRTGFWSALAVRIVPSAPFIVVNMAMGATHMRLLAFLAGTGVGIVPKTALVAFAGGGVVELAQNGGWLAAAGLFAAALGWLVAVLWVRRAFRARAAPAAESPDAGAPDAASARGAADSSTGASQSP